MAEKEGVRIFVKKQILGCRIIQNSRFRRLIRIIGSWKKQKKILRYHELFTPIFYSHLLLISDFQIVMVSRTLGHITFGHQPYHPKILL